MSETTDKLEDLGLALIHISSGYNAMRRALIECNETFRAYQLAHTMKLHTATGADVRKEITRKAEMNREMAEKCEALLEKYK